MFFWCDQRSGSIHTIKVTICIPATCTPCVTNTILMTYRPIHVFFFRTASLYFWVSMIKLKVWSNSIVAICWKIRVPRKYSNPLFFVYIICISCRRKKFHYSLSYSLTSDPSATVWNLSVICQLEFSSLKMGRTFVFNKSHQVNNHQSLAHWNINLYLNQDC